MNVVSVGDHGEPAHSASRSDSLQIKGGVFQDFTITGSFMMGG